MSFKSLVLSSSGLKNLVIGELKDDQFQFTFGQHKVTMSNIFAEFISPKVSNIHKLDPTINFISFNDIFDDTKISENVISKFKLIASGETIDINEEEISEMKLISILVDNKELFCKLSDLCPNDINPSNIDQNYLTILSKISPSCSFFNYSHIIDQIAGNFYLIDRNILKQLSKPILYSIICNSNLHIESEDWLFDFINEIFTNEGEKDDLISFYEQIEFGHLSESKLEEFLGSFSPSEMTNSLWMKLLCCFYTRRNHESSETNRNRYQGPNMHSKKNVSCEDGIFKHLQKTTNENIYLSKAIDVEVSAIHSGEIKNMFDRSKDTFFRADHSQNGGNGYIIFDFKNIQVNIDKYSLSVPSVKTGQCGCRPKKFVIEGSNDKQQWAVIDSRENEKSLDKYEASNTFSVQQSNDFYRFIRIQSIESWNGPSDHRILLSEVEFYGTIRPSS